MLIRPATFADIPAMTVLERDTPQTAHWPRSQYEAALTSSTPHRVALLIESESRMQGFVVARELHREWEIENIVVSGATRRQGLGTRLLAAFLDLVRSHAATAVFLEVRESNLAARGLYEKTGFMHSGTRPRYYRDPEEDAQLYHLIFL